MGEEIQLAGADEDGIFGHVGRDGGFYTPAVFVFARSVIGHSLSRITETRREKGNLARLG